MIYDRIEDYTDRYKIHYNTGLKRKETGVLKPMYNQDGVLKGYIDIYELNVEIALFLESMQNNKKKLQHNK